MLEKSKKSTRCIGLVIAFFIVGIDQLSKWAVTHSNIASEPLKVFPGFDITLSHNTGAAFGFLNNAGGWQRWFFVGLAFVISLIILHWLGRLKRQDKQDKLEALALSLILGGALGNLIDRVAFGHVVDFLLFYYQQWSFPVFNIADTAICIGVAFLTLTLLKK